MDHTSLCCDLDLIQFPLLLFISGISLKYVTKGKTVLGG